MNLELIPLIKQLTQKQRFVALAFLIAYCGALQLGIELYASPSILSPSSGIALSGLVLGGIAWWPLIVIATLLIYLANGFSMWILILFPIAYTLQSIVGASVLKRFKFDPSFGRMRDMLLFMAVAIFTALIVPILGLTARYLHFQVSGEMFLSSLTLGAWWTGTLMSILMTSPALLAWCTKRHTSKPSLYPIEIAAAFSALISINLILSWTEVRQVGNISLVYILLMPLTWIALRLGTRYAALAIFLMATISLSGIIVAGQMVSSEILGLRLFQAEVFINILAFLFYILAAVEEERKSTLQQLRNHVTQLENAVGMRDEFISIASHELKTPITTLRLYLQILQEEFEEKEKPVAEKVSKMDNQLNKLIMLVEDLLNISRTRLGKLEFNKEAFDINKLVYETTEDMRPNTQKHTLRIKGSVNRNVWGDRDRIVQVLINLISNAIKYSPKGNEVHITLQDEEDHVKVSVRDFGIGIDEVHHNKIFDLFYRVTDQTGKTFPGFGIGLHISHEIIKRHDGRIEVSSIKGRGSEFSFTLPYEKKAEEA